MKNTTKLLYLLMLLVVFQFSSCQKDEVVIVGENPEQGTLTEDSSLTKLLFRVSLNNVGNDDFIDGSSCFSIKFPFSVLVNDVEINIESENDYQAIINYITTSGSSLEDINISYPVTILFSDYSEIFINNNDELISYSVQCTEEEVDAIDCVRIVYPMQFFTYNSETEINDVQLVNEDKELNLFITSLTETGFITIQYPLSVFLTDDSFLEVSSNTELENLINNCDNASIDDIEELKGYLTSEIWYVSSFIDDVDETENYCEFEFSFTPEGLVNVVKDSTELIVGNWNIIAVGVDTKLMLNFPNEIPFGSLHNDWDILQGNSNQFELTGEGNNILKFDRNPTICEGSQISLISSYLTTGSWYVNYFFDFEDKTSNFCEYELTFNEDGTAIASDGSTNITGIWFVGTNNIGPFVGFDFGQDDLPFNSIWDNWDVLNASMNTLEIESDCDCGGMHYLTFGRTPTECHEDILFLEGVLQNGTWYVTEYFDDGIEETLDYYYYDLYFDSNFTVVAIYGSDVINGTWSVIGNEGDLEIVLEFENAPFSQLNTTWSVLDILIQRVKTESNTENDTLTLLKL